MSYFTSSLPENREEVIRRGIEWFEAIRKKTRLEPRYNNYFIVIKIDDGQYVLDEQEDEALHKAEEKYGRQNFFIHRCEFF